MVRGLPLAAYSGGTAQALHLLDRHDLGFGSPFGFTCVTRTSLGRFRCLAQSQLGDAVGDGLLLKLDKCRWGRTAVTDNDCCRDVRRLLEGRPDRRRREHRVHLLLIVRVEEGDVHLGAPLPSLTRTEAVGQNSGRSRCGTDAASQRVVRAAEGR